MVFLNFGFGFGTFLEHAKVADFILFCMFSQFCRQAKKLPYAIRGFLKPRLFEMREAVLRDEESHDVIIQFKSGLFWLRPMICGSHPKRRRLELGNYILTYSIS